MWLSNNSEILKSLRIELSRMEKRLKEGKWAGLEQEYQDIHCLLNTRHFMESGMYFDEWLKAEQPDGAQDLGLLQTEGAPPFFLNLEK